jgi:hypothetical protein
MKPEFPLLYKKRPLAQCGTMATNDARWRGVHSTIKTIDRARVHDMQIRKR